jgi:hypothetical protein
MSESVEIPLSESAVVGSPPPSSQPERAAPGDETRTRLHRLAVELLRTRDRRLLVEFLMLRRAVR